MNDQKVWCIQHCIWSAHLGNLSWLHRPFGPHPGDLIATPAFRLARPIFYCSLSLYSEVWVEEWDERGVRGWRGSILSYCLLRRRGLVDRKVFHYPESGDVSESLYLCSIFAVWSLISQLCSSLKASGFHFSFAFHPLCSELSLPFLIPPHPLLYLRGVPWVARLKKSWGLC